jgi:PASTA domain
MPGDISVPGLGEVPKKYAIGAVAVAAGLGVIVYIRARNTAKTAAAADTSTATADTSGYDPTIDPSTGIPYAEENAIDPSTGIPYAEENSGMGTSDYGGAGAYGTGYDAAGYPIGSSQDIAWSQQQTTGITTNNEWVQEAIGGSLPGDPGTIQTALSAVLGGLTVTTAQKNLFLEAVGVLGNPPQGYPPIHTSDTSAQPATPAKASATVKVPNTVGQTQAGAFAIISQAGLHPTGTPDVPGKILQVQSQSPKAGTSVARNSTVHLTSKVLK